MAKIFFTLMGTVIVLLVAVIVLPIGYFLWADWTDPEKTVLPVGSQAVVAEGGAIVWETFAKLEPGTRVTIGDDPGGRAPEDRSKSRKVRVVIETGEYRNASGSLTRSELRPIR